MSNCKPRSAWAFVRRVVGVPIIWIGGFVVAIGVVIAYGADGLDRMIADGLDRLIEETE